MSFDYDIRGESIKLTAPPDVMNPSPYSDFLAESIVEMNIPKTSIDLGCGCGILSILLAKCGSEKVIAIDNSESAVKTTRENAVLNGVENRVEVVNKDIYGDISSTFEADLVISNPPSLPMKETPDAESNFYNYYGGPDGRLFINELISKSKQLLTNNGKLMFINTSLANISDTLLQLVREDYSNINIEYTSIPFRDSYTEHIDWFYHLKEENISNFISINGAEHEILYRIETNI